MRKGLWTAAMKFIFTARKLTLLRNAASRFRLGSRAAATLNPSPAPPAGTVYVPVSRPDAIAELCLPTGEEQIDTLHMILIDLIQKNFIGAVRFPDQTLRYYATESGRKYVEGVLQENIEALLERILRDGHA